MVKMFEDFEDDVFGGDPWLEFAVEVDFDDFGVGEVEGSAAHGDSNVKSAGADGDHADAAAGGGVGVGAKKGFAWFAEAFQVDLMADAVAGAAVDDAVFGGDGLQVAVVVGVFEADLDGVVVDVADGQLGLDRLGTAWLRTAGRPWCRWRLG